MNFVRGTSRHLFAFVDRTADYAMTMLHEASKYLRALLYTYLEKVVSPLEGRAASSPSCVTQSVHLSRINQEYYDLLRHPVLWSHASSRSPKSC